MDIDLEIDDDCLKNNDLELFKKIDLYFNSGAIDIDAWKDYDGAIKSFDLAYQLLPDPKRNWAASLQILAAKGDAYFLKNDFISGSDVFMLALQHGDGHASPYIHLRYGQCLYETGNKKRALEELTIAYIAFREEIFETENPKYLKFIKKYLKNPAPHTEV